MPSFRDQVASLFTEAFGDPAILDTESGPLFRWKLGRANGLHVYVTLDSPEMPSLAHVIISDPGSGGVDPVQSVVMRTMAEAVSVLAKLQLQLRLSRGP
ncbi:MAG: hypothetical protein H7Y88_01150 [Phycisphaerales bacterium]|nr:hypothetical protein [Phycisphaerales bacterium]